MNAYRPDIEDIVRRIFPDWLLQQYLETPHRAKIDLFFHPNMTVSGEQIVQLAQAVIRLGGVGRHVEVWSYCSDDGQSSELAITLLDVRFSAWDGGTW